MCEEKSHMNWCALIRVGDWIFVAGVNKMQFDWMRRREKKELRAINNLGTGFLRIYGR